MTIAQTFASPQWMIALALCLLWISPVAAAADAPRYGIAMHGAPQLERGDPLPYTNPDAPQGGRITLGAHGTFNSLNPMIPRGTAAPGLRDLLYGNLIYESLLERNRDEPFALYGFLAREVIVPDDRSAITFIIDDKAAFSDGEPVTAEDIVFSYDFHRKKGWPFARSYYSKVERVETPDERTVTFHFPNANDRELPLILGLMPILPAHDTDPEAFARTTLSPPVGTGPYRIGDVAPGRSITYRRNRAYWGNDHPLNQGRYNAEEVRFLFYRDATALFEALKTGEIDALMETEALRWANGYDFPALKEGRVVRDVVPTTTPRGMWAFAMNTRRPPFDDVRVREAMNLLFDFEWINAQLYFGLRRRTDSYFTASDLASAGRPASDHERALLAPFPDAVTPDTMAGTAAQPVSDGSGRDRANIRAALRLLAEAGWQLDGGTLRNAEGAPFTFEILVYTRDDERLALAYARTLRLAGIQARVRLVDTSLYYDRMLTFDFDMARVYWSASLSPGNEQTNRWSAVAADTEGTLNYPGVREPAVDALLGHLLAERDAERFADVVRALDRVLLSGSYVVPLFHTPEQWIAHDARLGRPPTQSMSGVEWETWWVEP
ncbi:MAG: extracellular solute-binding protein [Acuticoccus sp.]